VDWDQLLGPNGVAVVAVVAAAVLWRDHKANDERREREIGEWKGLYLDAERDVDRVVPVAAPPAGPDA
jgi:hypothetical protein